MGGTGTGKVRQVSKMLKAIHAREDRRAAAEKMAAVITELRRQRLNKAPVCWKKTAMRP